MQKRFTSLSFLIGLFFLLVALVLLAGYFANNFLIDTINLYTGIYFLLFGLFMIFITPKKDDSE